MIAVLAVAGLLAAGCGTSNKGSNDGASAASSSTTAGESTTKAGATGEHVAITGVPGVTDSEIRFAALGTSTKVNPTGGCYLECFVEGIKAYFAYRNSEGGVNGRKLTLADPVDDALGNNQKASLDIISANDTFGVFDAPLVAAGAADLDKASVPTYMYLTDPSKGALTSLFGSPPPSCVACTRVDQPFAAKAIGAKKVAALGYGVDASATCAKSSASSIEKYSKDIGGAKVVYKNVALPFGLPNGLGPEVSAMKDAGVELVFACFDQNGTKTLGDEMRRQGMDAPIFENESYDPKFIEQNASAYEGAIMVTTIRPALADPTGTDRVLYEKWMAKTGGDPQPGITAHGWVLARLAYEGLKDAGATFDRKSVIDATNKIEDYTSGGLLAVPWDVGRQHQIPTEEDPDTHGAVPYCFVMVQIHDGKGKLMKPATAAKPSLCWKSRGGPSIEPEATNVK